MMKKRKSLDAALLRDSNLPPPASPAAQRDCTRSLNRQHRPSRFMAKTNPEHPSAAQRAGTYAIVASEYNREYVDGLLRNCAEELSAVAPGSTVVTHRVPGAFEVPLAAQEIARRGG